MTTLADLTTLRLGGPAGAILECSQEEEIVDAVRAADEADRPLLIVGGGSNLVVADEGFPGTVLRIASSGVRVVHGSSPTLEVQAGENWDELVARTVEDGLSGLECLSGIPGLAGATPIQNVGAYGADVAQSIVRVRAYHRIERRVVELPADRCGFAYRTSIFKRSPGRWVVLSVTFALQRSAISRPIAYRELARALGVQIGEPAPTADVRAAVLALRRSKGMVLAPLDPDTVSAGSFFLNPILDRDEFDRLRRRVLEECGPAEELPGYPEDDGRIKTSAAWLIDRAGFHPGYGDPTGIALSTKHALAITNRGGGTTAALLALAREIVGGVHAAFGVTLAPEPVLVGVAL